MENWDIESKSAPIKEVSVSGIVASETSSARVDNFTTTELLYDILVELKKLNAHMETITDERITEEDIL